MRLLEHCGHEVVAVENGRDAVQAALAEQWDVILMDVKMPVLDGLKATQKIRDLEAPQSRIPIVGLSSNAMDTDAKECIEAGMDGYITKPVSLKKNAGGGWKDSFPLK